tara:strand:- start:602 stop:943 length:342 start_codon:yes stop_codon:yes gene_type:complete
LVLDLYWPRAIHHALLVGWSGLLRGCGATKTPPDLEQLASVGYLSNTSNAVTAKVYSLGLVLPHLIVANLSYWLTLMASMSFPFSLPLCQICVHFGASFESKITELTFLVDRR